ncbi:MAG: hypothetical protein ABEL51_15145 [Salinibacter sp.]
MRSSLCTFFVVLLIAGLATAPPVQAQRTSGAAGLGVQAGEPSGITLKIYNPNSPSYDFLAAWSFRGNNFFFLNAHALFENPLSAQNVEQPIQWFIGPGAYIGVFEAAESEAGIGVSGTIGVDILLSEHFELYLQATPRFELVRETEPDLGGGLGLRYYF